MVAVADTAPQALSTESTEQDEEKKRIKQAEAKVRLREVSRARVHLTSSGLAPGTPETLAELTDPELRPDTPSEAIPAEVRNFRPSDPIRLCADQLLAALRSAGRGSSQDL